MPHSIPREADWSDFAFDEAFDVIELRPMTAAEYEAANRQHELWLAREQAEREELALSLEEELDALIATLECGEPAESKNAAPDPANWPDL